MQAPVVKVLGWSLHVLLAFDSGAEVRGRLACALAVWKNKGRSKVSATCGFHPITIRLRVFPERKFQPHQAQHQRWMSRVVAFVICVANYLFIFPLKFTNT